ncbi:TetR/AcrR family transcriptional regulator [Aliihoeflea sp. 40Bstr573]|uniref:TetR/AcrR family transcriptional regulator n=1 Tax=Aliihoeflea sp. 40Bstr573 TaxID=2696467 RepID=UPI0020940CDA|nr:TetR/AcrR family transcriptional regulator [Aliihoeflea sp. 40Bstr573]
MSSADQSHPSGNKPLGKRARQKIERPRAILAAALDEFMLKGFWAARVEDIAAKVGITKGTVYFYFDTKEKLFAETIRSFSPNLASESEPIDKNRPVREQLTTYLAVLYEAVAINPDAKRVFHLLISEGRHFPELLDQYFAEFLAPALDRITSLITSGIERGELKSTGLASSPEVLIGPAIVANLWGIVFADRHPRDIDAILTTSLDLFFRGLLE